MSDLSLVSVDSTTARAHHDAAGMRLAPGVLDALEKAAEEERARSKGARRKNKPGPGADDVPEQRRLRRRRNLRLKAAMLGRSRGGQTTSPAPGLTESPATRRIPPATTAPTCADETSRPSSRRRRTRPPTGRRGRRSGRPLTHDTDLYKERNTVERLINKLKAWRGIATRYDKTPESYLAGLQLRASMIWIKDLTQTAD